MAVVNVWNRLKVADRRLAIPQDQSPYQWRSVLTALLRIVALAVARLPLSSGILLSRRLIRTQVHRLSNRMVQVVSRRR
jgi:hypothetical protein